MGTFYYICQFTKRADILIPVALMIASIKVLTASNLRNEIVALTTSGISLKKILSPFLWAASLCTLFLYLNFQLLQPHSLNWIDSFEERYFRGSIKTDEGRVHSLLLEDNTLLIYQSFNHDTHCFFDLYWLGLKNSQTICRIKSLFPYEPIPRGEYVDILERNSNEEIVKTASYEELSFPGMRIDPKALFNAVHPPDRQSIGQLARTLGWRLQPLKEW